jgi:hypothetical protein
LAILNDPTNNLVQLTWPTWGVLQTATNLSGPWSDVTNGVGPISLPISSAPATFFRLATPPQNAIKQSILFYNASTGSGAIGTVVNDQFVNQAIYPDGSFTTGWSNITQVPSPGGPLFFFNNTALNGAFGNLGASNFVTYMTQTGFPSATHAQGVMWQGKPYLFFYNAANGAAVWGNNSAAETDSPAPTNAPAGWGNYFATLPAGFTHIERARQSGITLFYRAIDGSGMLDFSPSTLTLGAGVLPAGATHIASMPRPAGGDYVLFYRQTDGSAVLGWLDSAGFHTTYGFGAGSFGTWSHVLGLNGDLLFYNNATGAGAIASILSDTDLVTVGNYSFSPGWTALGLGDLDPEMQGFCWPESAPPGGTIDFFTSTAAGTYSFSYVQLFNQDTALVTSDTIANNGELVEQVLCGPYVMTGQMQNSADSAQGAFDWTRSFFLTVPSTWASGIYAVKLADSAGSITYIPFIVKPTPASPADFLLIANTSTWNTYNGKFGIWRYDQNLPGGPHSLSYLRPNPYNLNLGAQYNADAITVDYTYSSKHLTRGELWVQNWLQASGYHVDVVTDLDLHAGVPNLNSYKGLILSTHPEYFSTNMVNYIKSYLAQGGHLLYLGGNGLYDAVDIAPDLKSLTFYGNFRYRTHLFRNLSPQQPESALLGVAFPWSSSCGDMGNCPLSRYPYSVTSPSHRFFNGTGLSNGDTFGAQGWCVKGDPANNVPNANLFDPGASGASGWEVDVSDPGHPAPSGLQVLAVGTNPEQLQCSPYSGTNNAANMVYYDTGVGKGFVFSVGSMSFGGSLVVDPVIQQIMRNALDACFK